MKKYVYHFLLMAFLLPGITSFGQVNIVFQPALHGRNLEGVF